MKILLVSPPEISVGWQSMANAPYNAVRAMPCEVIECIHAKDANAIVNDVDVFFYDGIRYRHCEGNQFVIPDHVLLAHYDGDPFRDANSSFTRWPDIMISCQKELYAENRTQYANIEMCWLPGSCNVGDFDCPKDIDVLFWGQIPGYPFRTILHDKIMEYVTGEATIDDVGLYHYPAENDEVNFTYTILPARGLNRGLWGDKFYNIISRSRICVTGSGMVHGALGRYFENAAYGALTVTNWFHDSSDLGFEHNRNIWITDEEKFIDDLFYLLRNPDVVDILRWNAWKLIAECHTVDIRASQLYKILYKRLKRSKS